MEQATETSSSIVYRSISMLAKLILNVLIVPSLALYSSVMDLNLPKRISSSCPATGPVSCSSSAVGSCCFESPGGLIMQTQFWDTNPSTGPSNSWTIHGLWPDNCDGTFTQNCDPSRAYTNIAGLLTTQNASDTLSYMQTYWVDINGYNEAFWEHEWSTHGTCYSTFAASCVPAGSPKGAEAVAFFQSTVALFKTLPTYQWLADAGITPSATTTYSLRDLTSALQTAAGVVPAISCSGRNINQIYWYFYLEGSGIDGRWIPIDAPKPGSCASSGLMYPLKSGASAPSTSTTTTTTTPPVGTPSTIPLKGTISGLVGGKSQGGLLSYGTWSIQTLATYTFSGSAKSFTMTTSKGSCGVQSGKFSCGLDISASSFSAVTSGNNLLLAYQGSTDWSSDGSPSGRVQETVYTGSSHAVAYNLAIV